MIRASLRIAMAATLIGLGWIVAKAQTSEPDFEIAVSGSTGETTIECVRGCELSWVERGLNADARPTRVFTYKCSGSLYRCESGKVGGWIKR